MDGEQWLFLGMAVLAGMAAFHAVPALARIVRQRRQDRELDLAGLTAPAQIVGVEPMQRELNRAAGHPVTLRFQDAQDQARQARDTSGLGGYLAREGSQVVVRHSPTDPAQVRVETIVGRYGPYSVHPDGLPRRSLAGRVAQLVLSVAVGAMLLVSAIVGTETIEDRFAPVEEPLARWGPFVVLAGAVAAGVWTGLTAGAGRRQRERLSGQATGIVTDAWQERVSTGTGSTTVHPFTAHFTAADGREVHARCPTAGPSFRPDVHQQIQVWHDPAHPVRFTVPELRRGTAGQIVLATSICVVLLISGLIWLAAAHGG